jgi:hypothetical protein
MAMLLVAAGAPVAHGAAAPPDFKIGFTSSDPGAYTAMTLHILYKSADGENAKPPQIQKVALQLPAGTQVNPKAIPACAASDQEIQLEGKQACPPQSELGHGTLTVDTGTGSPVDPFATEVTLYNTPQGFVEIAQYPNTNFTLGIDRATLNGTTYNETPPQTPGGPPDGQTTVREVNFTFSAPGYFRTPSACPAEGVWTSRGTFTQADSPTMTVASTTPCASASSSGPEVSGQPQRSGTPSSGCSSVSNGRLISSAQLRRTKKRSVLDLRLSRAARVAVKARGIKVRRTLQGCRSYKLALPRSARKVSVEARSSAGVDRRVVGLAQSRS